MNGQLGICSWQDWKAMNEEMILIIRAHGTRAIPLVAGFNWAYDLHRWLMSPSTPKASGM
jgi:hypothetical protein